MHCMKYHLDIYWSKTEKTGKYLHLQKNKHILWKIISRLIHFPWLFQYCLQIVRFSLTFPDQANSLTFSSFPWPVGTLIFTYYHAMITSNNSSADHHSDVRYKIQHIAIYASFVEAKKTIIAKGTLLNVLRPPTKINYWYSIQHLFIWCF